MRVCREIVLPAWSKIDRKLRHRINNATDPPKPSAQTDLLPFLFSYHTRRSERGKRGPESAVAAGCEASRGRAAPGPPFLLLPHTRTQPPAARAAEAILWPLSPLPARPRRRLATGSCAAWRLGARGGTSGGRDWELWFQVGSCRLSAGVRVFSALSPRRPTGTGEKGTVLQETTLLPLLGEKCWSLISR